METIYEICCGGCMDFIEANSWDSALENAIKWVKDSDWGVDEKFYIDAVLKSYENDILVKSEDFTVLVGSFPKEPDCIKEELDWKSPTWLGGCKENPGVFGLNGTQYRMVQVCKNCGYYQYYISESTPGSYPMVPEQLWFEEPNERSELYVRTNE
jgi:predicted nucleic-acid-binding Zn-ribbon protein